ncbi:hypothetical protein NDU88_004073 [Pleurodeles waltl]|uniref:Uncharacterized protein n=1 Tax=Pleurodeles waltl TaxID=8319 RepID=A0AAV7NIR1_PLEWA|nr:hypothetical protein NDU88_004073 [Pleurodeles waltl]
MCWSRRDEKPFSDFHLECQLVMEVKKMTVHIYNQHDNIEDLTTFLCCHCTVTKEPSHSLDSDSNGKEESEKEDQLEKEGPVNQLDQITKMLQEISALASVMEASPPPSPATVEQEEASLEDREQGIPASRGPARRASQP